MNTSAEIINLENMFSYFVKEMYTDGLIECERVEMHNFYNNIFLKQKIKEHLCKNAK